MQPRRRWVLAVVLLAAACASAGHDAGFTTDYVVGATYATVRDRLIERTGALSNHLVVKPPQLVSAAAAPGSVADYEANPSRWPNVRGILPAGSRLRVSRLVRRGPWPGLPAIGEVYAEVLDGPHAGLTVELSFISRNVEQSGVPTRAQWVDPAELVRIDAP